MPDSLLETRFLQGLSASQGRHVLKQFSRLKVPKNKILFSPRKKALYFYLVLSGEFKIEALAALGRKRLLAYARAGDILGETALLTDMSHSARVTASLDSEVLRLKQRDFNELLLKYPQLAINLGQIEASRLRSRLSTNKKEVLPNQRFIAHFTGFDEVESHYIGLNLASAISKALAKPIAYVHLSRSEQTPIISLNLNLSDNRLSMAIEKLRKYSKFNLKNWAVRHDSGLVMLPSLPGKLPVQILKPNDLPRLISILGLEFPLVFMELGSVGLESAIATKAIRQADQLILGTTPYKASVNQLKKQLKYFEKKVPGLLSRTHLYLNSITCKDFGVDPQVMKERLLLSQIEERLKHPVDFRLSGEINTMSDYYRRNLLVNSTHINKAVVTMRSLGRWLVNRSVGIAFGGGGARALAQIGVLRQLEKENIHFDSVAGTSMGALIGALYAMDLSSEEIEQKFAEILPDDSVFVDYSLPFISFFRGRKANKLLKKAFGNTRIEDLSIPFKCVAVDLLSGREVHIEKGLVWRAVRASMSLPVIFPPVRYKGMYLIDGGALNVVPGDILKRDRVHRVVGINCTPLEDDSLANYIEQTNLFRLLRPNRRFFKNLNKLFALVGLFIRRPPILQIANRSMMLEGAELIRSKSHIFDILLTPDVKSFGLFDFHKREELVAAGLKTAKKHLKRIKQVLGK